MATRLEAARLLTYGAAEVFDKGERCDMEAGMAKLSAYSGYRYGYYDNSPGPIEPIPTMHQEGVAPLAPQRFH